MKELEVVYRRASSPIVRTIHGTNIGDEVPLTDSGSSFTSRLRLRVNQRENFCALPKLHHINSHSAPVIKPSGDSLKQIYNSTVFIDTVQSLQNEFKEEQDHSHTENYSESESAAGSENEEGDSDVVLNSRSESFALDDPRGIVIGSREDLGKFRSLIQYETDAKIVYFWEKLPRVICPFLIQASVELMSFIVLLIALPKNFTYYALTEVVIAWPLRITYVLLACALFASAASLCLAFTARTGLFGKRWMYVGRKYLLTPFRNHFGDVSLVSGLTTLLHIYGSVYMIGSVIRIMDQMEIIMTHEMSKGFNSSLWTASQQFFGCCGMTNYLSWNAIKNNSEQVPKYPQSCCDRGRWHCDKLPIGKNVFENGCLDAEVRMFTIVVYSLFWLLSLCVFYSGFVTYVSLKFHRRFRWLEENRDIFVAFKKGGTVPKIGRRHSEPGHYFPADQMREVFVTQSWS